MAVGSIRLVWVLFLGLVAAVALLVGAFGAIGVGGVDPAAAGKPESRKECREKPRGGHEWREHHCGRFR